MPKFFASEITSLPLFSHNSPFQPSQTDNKTNKQHEARYETHIFVRPRHHQQATKESDTHHIFQLFSFNATADIFFFLFAMAISVQTTQAGFIYCTECQDDGEDVCEEGRWFNKCKMKKSCDFNDNFDSVSSILLARQDAFVLCRTISHNFHHSLSKNASATCGPTFTPLSRAAAAPVTALKQHFLLYTCEEVGGMCCHARNTMVDVRYSSVTCH
jgi:hypothetical protein